MSEHQLHKQNNKKILILFLIMQFFVALSDNALFFAEIAKLKSEHSPGWEIPLLQEFFIIGYIVLAPFMALIADKWSKKYVLLGATLLKLAGTLLLIFNLNPLVCCIIIGIGCATFSPAKYGVLPELVEPTKLVKANGFLEGVTIFAILIGVMLGGILSDHSTNLAFGLIICLLIISVIINLYIPHIPAAAPEHSFEPKKTIKDFIHSLARLFKMPETRYSILFTSIFGASGATLRYLLVAWVPVALMIKDNEVPAMLNSFVAIGLAIGAVIAGKFITIKTVNKVSGAGIAIGLIVVALAYASSIEAAGIYLVTIGILGGFFIIPLNALVQEEGKKTVGSGHAVAVQNFSENILMLIMVGAYSYLLKIHTDIITLAVAFGLFMTFSISVVTALRTFLTK